MKKAALKKKLTALGALLLLSGAGSQELMADEGNKLHISGFVDASLFENQYDKSSFGLDQVEIDFEKKIDQKLSARVDINYLPKGEDDPATPEDEDALRFDDLVEQGYVTYSKSGFDLTFGKFNAPIGFELLDPVDMYQYSHALVFDYGLPTNLTGMMGAYGFGEKADLALYVVNGWDNNYDNNNSRTVGGRFGLTSAEGINVGLSGISGKEGTTDDKLTVYDVDFTLTAVKNLTIGAEYNSGVDENVVAAGQDGEWTAYMLMANYAFSDLMSLTARYDNFDDKDGTRLDSGIAEERKAYTLAALFSLGDGAGFLAEYRLDKSDKDVFDNGLEDAQKSYAIEFTYAF